MIRLHDSLALRVEEGSLKGKRCLVCEGIVVLAVRLLDAGLALRCVRLSGEPIDGGLVRSQRVVCLRGRESDVL